jgi:hypothetical protein
MQTADPFRTLYDANNARVLRLLVRLVGPQDAEDLTQTVFAKAAKGLPDFRGAAETSIARQAFRSVPHCDSNGRFTSISGHKTADSVWRDGTGAQEGVSAGHRYIIEPIEPAGIDPPFEPMLLPTLRSQETARAAWTNSIRK